MVARICSEPGVHRNGTYEGSEGSMRAKHKIHRHYLTFALRPAFFACEAILATLDCVEENKSVSIIRPWL